MCILSIPVQPVVVVSKLGGGRAGCFCVLSLAYELMTFEEEPNIPEDWKKDSNIIDQVSIIRAVDPGGRWYTLVSYAPHPYVVQWSLSTCKKHVGDRSIVPYTVEPLYKGQVGDGSFVPYTVEPLYKGQVGDRSFVPYTVEPFYKGQVGDGSFVPYTVEPFYKGQVGDGSFVPYTVKPLKFGYSPCIRIIKVLFSEVTKIMYSYVVDTGRK